MRAKLTIEQMHALAQAHDGVCLSTVYVNSLTKLRWRCSVGHEWEAVPASVKHNDSWCPECAGHLRGTIEKMQVLAKAKNGVCLSKTYGGANSQLRWRCAEGHEWETTPSKVKNGGQWCPVCAGTLRGTIEQMQALAQAHDGVCLSTVYVNQTTKLRWRCSKGHEWEAAPRNVKHLENWCPECAGNSRGTIEEMQALAQQQNGVCLSTVYVNSLTKLRWRCSVGHEWEAVPASVKHNDSWCPECAGNSRGAIEEMQVLAKAKNGVCLSKTYVGALTNLRWRCAEGHEWETTPSNVKNTGAWCPTCSQGHSERIVRDICEQLFGTPFPKARPKWLRNSRGNQMELDGYCKRLSLAFEYQGIQHYEETKFSRRSPMRRTLGQQKKDDARKRRLCRANGVHLLAIPFTVELDDVPAYIASEVKNLRLPVRMKRPDTIKVAQFVLPEYLRAMQALAREHDGECLSTVYVNSLTKLRWRCSVGHEWEAVPNSVKNTGTWCPACGSTKLTIEQMQALAKKQNGVCLSTVYVNSHTKLRWRCSEGHEWDATPNHVKNSDRWCPACGSTKFTIEQMQVLAQQRNGVCLSTRYVNNQTKLRWRCSKGHEWEATPASMKARVNWCTKCPRVARRRAPA